MNRADADQVLAILSAPHGFTTEADTMEVWYQAALERCDAELATAVAVRLVECEERFPTPARFNKERSTIERERWAAEQERMRTAAGLAEQQGLPAPGLESPAEQRLKFIREIRGMLAQQQSNLTQHWHGGPDPCPVCGGLNPNVVARMDEAGQNRVAILQQQHRDARKHLAR